MSSLLQRLDNARARQVDAWLDQAMDLDAAGRVALIHQAKSEDAQAGAALERLIAALDGPSALDQALIVRDEASAPSATLAPGTRLGAWRVEELAGRGGMASVYRAVRADGGFAQEAAIKVVDSTDSDLVSRFKSERALLAQLDHPHIARLLDGGTTPDRRLWFAMSWVDGHDLDVHLAIGAPSLRTRLELFRQVAGAVAHAHRQLIVHRDLKPRNVRVTDSGQAILLDFGIARLLASATDAAPTRAMMTPQYAAPEQLAGGPIGTWTDVHGLGVLLYEMLAGMHPYPAASGSLAAAVQSILNDQPRLPSHAARQYTLPYPSKALSGDLDAIIARCLAKEPRHRYVSADALLDDLERQRRLLPVAARRGAWRYRAGRWIERNWRPATLGAAALLSMATGLVAFAIQAQRITAERDSARIEIRRQEALREHLMLAFREGAAQGGGASAKEILDASAAQLDELYGADPGLRRSVLLAMGELYFTLGDYPAARAMLERFLAAAGTDTPDEDRVLGHTQQAQVLLRMGEREAAVEELAAAETLRAAGSRVPREIDAQLLSVRSQLARSQGDIESGVELQRAAVEATLRAVDTSPHRLGIAESNLGMALLQANRLEPARVEFERALATFSAAGYGRSVHAITTIGNLANAENLLGRLQDADRHYRQAMELASVAMAESAAMAALHHNHARLLLTLHRLSEAQERNARALTMAGRYVGADSLDVAGMRLTEAEIAWAAGDSGGALQAIAAAREIYAARLGPAHPLHARAELVAARIELSSNPAAALSAMQTVIAKLESAPPLLTRQAIRGAIWLAEAALELGDFESAANALQRAAALPAHAELPDWEQAELRLWRRAAGTGAISEDWPDAAADRALLAAALGGDHPRLLQLNRSPRRSD